jgi:hypothetical protein
MLEPEATSSSLMVQCSRHVIPPAIQVILTDRPAHDLDSRAQGPAVARVLTDRRLGTSLPHLVDTLDRAPLAWRHPILATIFGKVTGVTDRAAHNRTNIEQTLDALDRAATASS